MAGYLNGILLEILRDALDPVEVVSLAPANTVALMPLVWARSVPGGITKGPALMHRFGAPIQIDAFHTSARAAHDLADDAVQALREAWQTQTVTSDGSIGWLRNVSGPSEVRESDQPDGLHRWLVTATLNVTPA